MRPTRVESYLRTRANHSTTGIEASCANCFRLSLCPRWNSSSPAQYWTQVPLASTTIGTWCTSYFCFHTSSVIAREMCSFESGRASVKRRKWIDPSSVPFFESQANLNASWTFLALLEGLLFIGESNMGLEILESFFRIDGLGCGPSVEAGVISGGRAKRQMSADSMRCSCKKNKKKKSRVLNI